MRRRQRPTSKRQIKARDRQRQALELRRGGASYDAIAQQLGYASRAGAQKAVFTALQDTIQEPADDLRTLMSERLHRLFLTANRKATAGDGDMRAADVCVRIIDRHCKIFGLDQPQKVALTSPDGKSEWQSKVESLSDEKLEAIEMVLVKMIEEEGAAA